MMAENVHRPVRDDQIEEGENMWGGFFTVHEIPRTVSIEKYLEADGQDDEFIAWVNSFPQTERFYVIDDAENA